VLIYGRVKIGGVKMKSKVKLTLVFVILITMFFSNSVYLNAEESML
jgi:hypothetical protein